MPDGPKDSRYQIRQRPEPENAGSRKENGLPERKILFESGFIPIAIKTYELILHL
jgi:hypothetical protein